MKHILQLIPHRFPFILIDRILNYENKRFIRSIKNITINDPWLQGHFPKFHIFPAVLILESIVQSGIILLSIIQSNLFYKEGFYCITNINNTIFKKFIVPGDTLIIEVQIINIRKNTFLLCGSILLDNTIVCTSNIVCKYIFYVH
ncbi:3-hydroxyacyl-[acyl-carrier-protein] dehydratase FabZ [Buchnera aphidicola (Pterocallis alni)]|uniref:3-hydroxyacyl-ACP dehydratase FabZ n=1 Tax=Buchnera aphidicola TaxID=9 RepID=UPI0034648702